MYFKFSTLGLRLKLLILESGGITLDYETIEGEAQGLQTASKLSGIQSDHHKPQIRKIKFIIFVVPVIVLISFKIL